MTEPIKYNDFAKVELKVATILEAAEHPNADKLLVLLIDLGTEKRTICAGIRQHYSLVELVGKQIIVVTNLEPRNLRGVPSNGMLLAATDAEGKLALVTTERPIAAGSKVG